MTDHLSLCHMLKWRPLGVRETLTRSREQMHKFAVLRTIACTRPEGEKSPDQIASVLTGGKKGKQGNILVHCLLKNTFKNKQELILWIPLQLTPPNFDGNEKLLLSYQWEEAYSFRKHFQEIQELLHKIGANIAFPFSSHINQNRLKATELWMVWFSIWSQNKGGKPEFNHSRVLCLECNVSGIDLGFSYYIFSQWFSRQLFLRTYSVSGTVWGPGKAPMSYTISIPVLVILTMSHR